MIKNNIVKLKLTFKIWDRRIRLSPEAVEDTTLMYIKIQKFKMTMTKNQKQKKNNTKIKYFYFKIKYQNLIAL